MKSWTLKFRETDRDLFDDVVNNIKSIETRAATERYRPIKTGDVLVFVCGKDRLEKTIKSVKHFASLDEMLNELDLKSVLPHVETIEEAKRVYHSFPGYEQKIRDYGLLAFELS